MRKAEQRTSTVCQLPSPRTGMNLNYYIQLILIITYKLVVIWGSAINLINYRLLHEINKSGSEH
jgi:hypothetical protein